MGFVMSGLGAGALHAVAGPDHLLSLGPVALAHPRPFHVGLRWGVGHGLGTLLLALPLVLLVQAAVLPDVATWGDRLGAVALLGMAAWSWRSLRARASATCGGTRSAFLVGLVHGVGGAGSLVLLLPVVARGSDAHTAAFLATFAVGSAIAMASLTSVAARFGARLQGGVVARVQRAVIALSGVGGAGWLASTFA